MSSATTDQWQERFDRLRSNKAFELLVITIIIVSALLIGAKTYELPPLVQRSVIFLDWGITLFFLTEITVRFLGEPEKKRFFRSGWNIFDTLIVVVSLIPIQDSDLALKHAVEFGAASGDLSGFYAAAAVATSR